MTETEWTQLTTELLKSIHEGIGERYIITNAGYNYSKTTPFLEFINGFGIEAFLSGGAGFDDGPETAGFVLEETREPHLLIYTVYAVNASTSAAVDSANIRLALSLSLLFDHTYLAYDKGVQDYGARLWQIEFSTQLCEPVGEVFQTEGAYRRDYENGIVVSAPHSSFNIESDETYLDVTAGTSGRSFTIESGDGRVFLRSE